MYKYRIVQKPNDSSYYIQYKPTGLLSLLVEWSNFMKKDNLVDAQRCCLDEIERDEKYHPNKINIIETYDPERKSCKKK